MKTVLTLGFLIILMKEEATGLDCPRYQWRCRDGSCISFDGKCDGVVDCGDGSDETHALCRKSRRGPNSSLIQDPKSIQRFRRGKRANKNSQPFYASCSLMQDKSVEFVCRIPRMNRFRICREIEPHGTLVQPVCKRPKYMSLAPLPFMRCYRGLWNYIARCRPAFECGLIPENKNLALEGKTTKHSVSPWHVGIYRRFFNDQGNPYFRIECSGTLVSSEVVLSAAQCFVRDITQNDTSILHHLQFTVAAGKTFSPWNDAKLDAHSQKRTPAAVHVPAGFRGWETNYQDDIAVLIVSKPFEFNEFVSPVCLNFDSTFNDWQLIDGKKGKLSGWAVKHEGWQKSVTLLEASMEYTPVEKCLINSNLESFQLITSDKICAGQTTKALCRMENGGGLVFPEREQDGRLRYYLRGVLAFPPGNNQTTCLLHYQGIFTAVDKHELFLKKYLPSLI